AGLPPPAPLVERGLQRGAGRPLAREIDADRGQLRLAVEQLVLPPARLFLELRLLRRRHLRRLLGRRDAAFILVRLGSARLERLPSTHQLLLQRTACLSLALQLCVRGLPHLGAMAQL